MRFDLSNAECALIVRFAPRRLSAEAFSFQETRIRCRPPKKKRQIEELRERIAAAKNLFFTNYAGLTVAEVTKLRSELRKSGDTYAIIKNTLFSIAAGEEVAKPLESFLAGPTGVVFAGADPVAPAKALKTFSTARSRSK